MILKKEFIQDFLAFLVAIFIIFSAYIINFSNSVYATSCDIYNGNQFNCEAQTGCTWDPTQSCSDYNNNQSTCQAQSGCSYPGNEGQCSEITDQNICDTTSGCTKDLAYCEWDGSFCVGGSECGSYPEIDCSFATYFSSCTGFYDNGVCNGTYSPETCSGDFDNTAPVISEVTPVTTPTNDSTPSYTFTTDEAGTITYEGSCSSETTSASIGNNTITFSSLSDGSYADCIINVTDESSNISSDLEVTLFTIDTNAPSQPGTPDMTSGTDSGSSSSDNITNDTTPTFTSSCESGATVYLKESNTVLGNGSCSSSSVTITSSTLSGGAHSIIATQVDTASNISATSSALSITIDTTAPITSGAPDMTSGTDSGSSSSDNITNDTTPTFTGACTDGNTVQLYDDGVSSGSSATCASSVFSLTTGTLASGSNSITFKETDLAGNTSTASDALSVTIDTTAPTISEVTSIPTGTDTTPDYTFTTNEAGTITYGGSCTSLTTSVTSGSNTITLEALTAGTYTDCTIIVTDASGNASNTLTLTSFTISTASSGTTTTTTTNSSGTSRRNISSQSNTAQTNTQTNTSNTLGSKVSIITIPKTFSFTRNLSLNMRGEDIINLQKFLNATGFIVSKTGNGSPGREIQRFGPGTRAALAKFQASVGIKPSIGYFGPITQSYINSILKGR